MFRPAELWPVTSHPKASRFDAGKTLSEVGHSRRPQERSDCRPTEWLSTGTSCGL